VIGGFGKAAVELGTAVTEGCAVSGRGEDVGAAIVAGGTAGPAGGTVA
jgi:hypothetical protein